MLYKFFEEPETFKLKFESDENTRLKNITSGFYNLHSRYWDKVPTEAKDFIRKLV
jgi:hypothetical protein